MAVARAPQQGEHSWQDPAADAWAAGAQAQAASEAPRHTALQLQTWQVAAGWTAGCCWQRVARHAWAGKGHAALRYLGPLVLLHLPGSAGSGLLQAARRLPQGSDLLHVGKLLQTSPLCFYALRTASCLPQAAGKEMKCQNAA